MSSRSGKGCKLGLIVLTAGLVGMGCATTSSTRAKPLKVATGAEVDLTRYQVATVLPFEIQPGRSIDQSVGRSFSEQIAKRLEYDFGSLFTEVRREAPLGKEDELIVTGTIKTYRPGSRFARYMLIGLGSAGFEGDLILKNGADNSVVLTAPFDKLWAWGGTLGASKGIEDMMAETAASIASTVAHAKGWTPASGSEGPKQ